MIALSPQIEQEIKALVASGRFHSEQEVVQEALKALKRVVVPAGPVQPDGVADITSLPYIGGMKGTIRIIGDIVSPREDWFDDGLDS